MKKVILSILALFALLAAASLYVYYFLDVNSYKPQITKLVKENSGYDIEINGDMHLRLLPDISVDINRVFIHSAHKDASEDALYIKQLLVHLKLLPLLSKRIEIASLKLINPEIKFIIYKDGSNSFAHAKIEDAAPEVKGKKAPAEPEVKLANYQAERDLINNQIIDKFSLGKIIIQAGKIYYADERKGVSVKLDKVDFETSVHSGVNPIKMIGEFDSSTGVKAPIEMVGQYQLAKDKYDISGIEIKFGKVQIHGEAGLNFLETLPEVKFAFYLEDADLTPYAGLAGLAGSKESADKPESVPEAKPIKGKKSFASQQFWSDEKIDFMALRNFNANLSVKANKLTYKDASIGGITIYAYLRNGKFTFSIKEAEIFGGNLNTETTIDVTSSVPKIKHKLNVEELDLAALPKDIVDVNKFTGKVNGGTTLTSHGDSQKEIIDNLVGAISLKAEEGFIKNIDMISMAKNIVTAFDINKNRETKTAFKELSCDFDVNGGDMKTTNLKLISDILDFSGQGNINLPEMSINMKILPKVKLVKDETDLLGGIKAPILITGSVLQPSFRLEIQTLVEDLIKNPKATENLVKQLKSDFKGIKNNIKNGASGQKDGGVADGIQNLLKGF